MSTFQVENWKINLILLRKYVKYITGQSKAELEMFWPCNLFELYKQKNDGMTLHLRNVRISM